MIVYSIPYEGDDILGICISEKAAEGFIKELKVEEIEDL